MGLERSSSTGVKNYEVSDAIHTLNTKLSECGKPPVASFSNVIDVDTKTVEL